MSLRDRNLYLTSAINSLSSLGYRLEDEPFWNTLVVNKGLVGIFRAVIKDHHKELEIYKELLSVYPRKWLQIQFTKDGSFSKKQQDIFFDYSSKTGTLEENINNKIKELIEVVPKEEKRMEPLLKIILLTYISCGNWIHLDTILSSSLTHYQKQIILQTFFKNIIIENPILKTDVSLFQFYSSQQASSMKGLFQMILESYNLEFKQEREEFYNNLHFIGFQKQSFIKNKHYTSKDSFLKIHTNHIYWEEPMEEINFKLALRRVLKLPLELVNANIQEIEKILDTYNWKFFSTKSGTKALCLLYKRFKGHYHLDILPIVLRGAEIRYVDFDILPDCLKEVKIDITIDPRRAQAFRLRMLEAEGKIKLKGIFNG